MGHKAVTLSNCYFISDAVKDLVKADLNPMLKVAGVVMTMFDSRTNLAADVVKEVRKHFPEQVFKTVIPRNIRLSEAPSYGEDVLAYAPNSVGCKAYHALTEELLNRIRHTVSNLEEGQTL